MFFLFTGEFLLEAVTEVLDDFGKMPVFVQGLGSRAAPVGIHSFDPMFTTALPTPVNPIVRREVTQADICCYIYTSGTTGMQDLSLHEFILLKNCIKIVAAMLT